MAELADDIMIDANDSISANFRLLVLTTHEVATSLTIRNKAHAACVQLMFRSCHPIQSDFDGGLRTSL